MNKARKMSVHRMNVNDSNTSLKIDFPQVCFVLSTLAAIGSLQAVFVATSSKMED
jgi:hypothetical protein